MRIEWTWDAGFRKRLKRIESCEDQLAQSIVAARQRTICHTAPHHLKGVANGIRAGCAGVGNDPRLRAKAQRPLHPDRLALRLVVLDLGELPTPRG